MQGDDVVNYTYDKANRLKTVADASGTIDVTNDEDGKVEQIKFPGTDRRALPPISGHAV